MKFDSLDEEVIILESNDDSTRENGDIMMLEELYRQEKFIESLQQFTENELSKLDDPNTEEADIELIADFNSGKTFSPTLFQENTNYENIVQLDEDEFIDLVLANEDVILVESQLFVDCGTIDYDEIDEFQINSIPAEYLTTDDSCSDPLGDPKLQCQARVCLEKLPKSVTKVKDTSKVITDQKIKSKVSKKPVQLYCHKCEKFEINTLRVSMPKNCQDCDNLLLYLCTKCKEKYFVNYSAMRLHRKICKSTKITAEIPRSLFVYDCQDCDFRTLYEDSVDRHVRKTKHKLNEVDGHLRVDKSKDVKHTRQFEKDYVKAFKRFCKNCNEITSSTSRADEKLCKKCDTPLLYRCIECSFTSKTYNSLMYHLKNKCFSIKYKCKRCDFVSNKWKLINRHVKQRHSSIKSMNCEYCNYKTDRKNDFVRHLVVKHNVGFCCKVCNKYTTLVADRLKRHILRRHVQKKNKASEIFECAICRRYSTGDRDDLWKHIERRHCEK